MFPYWKTQEISKKTEFTQNWNLFYSLVNGIRILTIYLPFAAINNFIPSKEIREARTSYYKNVEDQQKLEKTPWNQILTHGFIHTVDFQNSKDPENKSTSKEELSIPFSVIRFSVTYKTGFSF